MIDHPLLAVGALLIASFLGGRAANALHLPRVSGYLVAGLILSPSFTHVLPKAMITHGLSSITETVLGVIAYSIGGSLVYHRLKHLGRSILSITFIQTAGAFLFTALCLRWCLPFITDLSYTGLDVDRLHWAVALTIGAISAATAPGAVLAIISELRAKGPFTTTLLGVIALDDGLTIVFFALAGTIAHSLLNPGSASLAKVVLLPLWEIGLSVCLGTAAGLALKFLARLARRRESLLMVVLGIICFTSGLALVIHVSPLLSNMIAGFFIANLERRHHQLFNVVEQVEEPLFGLFFSLAGAHFDIEIIKAAGLLALFILFVRMAGKQIGTWAGARISNASPEVRKYLGLGLFPQAGVTVGLVLVAKDFFPVQVGDVVVNAVIASVILNELIAPPMVTFAIKRAGEASN